MAAATTYSIHSRVRKWLKMPRPNPVSKEVLLGTEEVEIKAWPDSKWRFIPTIGHLWLFRLGIHVVFRVQIRLLRSIPIDSPLPLSQKGYVEKRGDVLRISFEREGTESSHRREQDVFFIVPRICGEYTEVRTQPFYPTALGTHELKMGWVNLYACEIWEPSTGLINWLVALLAGGVGAFCTWLFTR